MAFKGAEQQPTGRTDEVSPEAVKASGESQSATAGISELKAGMESKAGEKLLEKLGIKIDLGENAKYFDSIIHDLGEDFVDFITQRKDIYTTENLFISSMKKFVNTANADMAKFIHDYKKGGREFNEYELQALFENPEKFKDFSEFYRIAQETGLGDVINADAAWKSIDLFSGYFKPGDGSVIRKNLTALKQSGIKFDASDGVTVTLSTMGALKDKSPEDILALLNKINDATGGKIQNDSSLSAFIESATKQPETFDEALKYGKLFEDAVSVIQQFGTSGYDTLKFSTPPEMLEALIILVKKPREEDSIANIGNLGQNVSGYRSLLDNEQDAKNLLDIVKLLDKELSGLKITTPQQVQILGNYAHFRTTDELKSIITELKGYVENPSLHDLTNYVNLKKLKKNIETTISLLPQDKQDIMRYLCAPENILKHSESEIIDSSMLLTLREIALGDPQRVKEMYILPDDVLKARGKQFSFDELSQIVQIVRMSPKEYEVFKGLMVLDGKNLHQRGSDTEKKQLYFTELRDLSREAFVKNAPESSVIINRVKELFLLHRTPGIKTAELNINEIKQFLSLSENQYNRVKELYMVLNKPATQIAETAKLPDAKYAKFKSEYVDKIDEYKELSFQVALVAMQKSEDLFDAVTELAKTGYNKSSLNCIVNRLSLENLNNFNKTEFVNKLAKLNRNISIETFGITSNLKDFEPERINDFLQTLLNSKKQLQHNDRPLLTDSSIYNLINNPYARDGEIIKLFAVLDDEAIKASISGKYDGVKHMIELTPWLRFYNNEKISVLKEKLAQLPTPQQRLEKFIAIMEVSEAENRSVMELVDILKSPKITDEQIQTMKTIFASDKPYEQQIEDFIREMNVPKATEQKVRDFLTRTNYKERISRKTVDTKAELAKIERNIAATIANDKMPQDKKDARLAQLNAQKEALKNKQDGTTITMSSGALSDLTRIVEQHINIVNNDIEFNRALTDKIYKKHGIQPSSELRDKIQYDRKYTAQLLSGNNEFSPEYGKLIELLDTDPQKPLSELRESIPENQATRKLFEENGLDYEKWIKFDETFEKPFTLEVDARSALDAVQRNAAAEFSSDLVRNLPKKDRDFIESVIADVYKNKFKTDKPLGYISNNGFVKQDGTALNRQQHITLIQNVIDKIKENKEFGIEKQADGTTKLNENVNEFLNHLESRIKDLNDAAQLKDMSEELYVRLSDDDDIGRNIFFGNHVSCSYEHLCQRH